VKFNEKTKQMYLAEYYPGVSSEEISETRGSLWNSCNGVRTPSEYELKTLRERDPQRLILGDALRMDMLGVEEL
jgi:glutaconate CoA-transferase subunit B